MKYYIYISPTKIQMLFDQLPTSLRQRLPDELNIDLQVVSTSFKKPTEGPNLFSKLEAVLNSLDAETLGSVSQPSKFFRGTLAMRWAPIKCVRSRGAEDRKLVLFAGSQSSSSKKVVGLVGSLAHVIGSHVEKPMAWYYTSPAFIGAIADALWEPKAEEVESSQMYGVYPSVASLNKGEGHVPDVPQQQLEFVAKYFYSNDRVLLGSPLYVALAE